MSGHEERHGITDERHERLCAWLFGELEGEAARAFEAELAASPELRAERARLEATIALVRAGAGGGGGEELSDAARERVLAAAGEEPAPRRWTLLRGGRAGWLVAAGLLVAFGTLVVVRTKARRGLLERWRAEEVARQAAPSGSLLDDARDGNETGAASAAMGRREGYEIAAPGPQGSFVPPSEPGVAGPPPVPAETEADELREELAALGYGDPAKPPRQRGSALPTTDDETLEALRGLGYASSDPGDSGDAEGKRRSVPTAIARERAGEPAPTDTPRRRASATGSGGSLRDAPDPSAPEATEVLGIGGGSGGSFGGRRIARGGKDLGKGAPSSGSEMGSTPVPSMDPQGNALFPALGERGGAGGTVPPSGSEILSPGSLGALRASGYAEREVARTGSDGFFLGGGRGDFDARPWTEAELDERCRRIWRSCRIQPRETPSAMFFRCWGDNPFEYAALDALSTFSVDVDRASYTLARRYLADGYLPTKEQVRTEEFVNAFDADVEPPERGETFALALELLPSPFAQPGARMLRVVVRGEDVEASERKSVALTFVLDVSGSMSGERIGLVKQAIALCVGQLSTTDSIALVAFSNEARLVSPMVSAASRAGFESALVGLTTGGGTNVAAGLELGYELAASALTPGATNRVVLLSDGVGNIGATDQQTILASVAGYRDQGIYLNAIGVGMGNHNDAFLEQLADRGDGVCHYVDRFEEARRVFVDELVSTLQPIARDVKIQVAFDPEQVERYRLLGYENRAIADADFRNDAVDAGEVHAGHQVVALYEVVPRADAAAEAPLAVARLRWKAPFAVDRAERGADARAQAERAFEKEVALRPADVRPSFEAASFGARRAVLVAQLAEFLRRSVHARGDSFGELAQRVQVLAAEGGDPQSRELLELVTRAAALAPPEGFGAIDELQQAVDDLCRLHYLEGRRRQLEGEAPQAEGEELAREADELRLRLEERIRELLRERKGVEQR